MVSTLDIVDNAVTAKHNFANEDQDEDPYSEVFKEKVRVWNQYTKVELDGNVEAVLIPFDLFFEPFYTDSMINTDGSINGTTLDNSFQFNLSGYYDWADKACVYDSTNHYVRLYSDANGNYKYLESPVLCFQRGKSIRSVLMTVTAEDTSGNDAINNVEMYIYNGNEWLPTLNGVELFFTDYTGIDLDADLDALLGGQYDNFIDTGSFPYNFDFDLTGLEFENQIKYKVVRTGSDEVRVTQVKISVTWKF